MTRLKRSGRNQAMVTAAAAPELQPSVARPCGSSVNVRFGYAALIIELLSTAGRTSWWMKRA